MTLKRLTLGIILAFASTTKAHHVKLILNKKHHIALAYNVACLSNTIKSLLMLPFRKNTIYITLESSVKPEAISLIFQWLSKPDPIAPKIIKECKSFYHLTVLTHTVEYLNIPTIEKDLAQVWILMCKIVFDGNETQIIKTIEGLTYKRLYELACYMIKKEHATNKFI